MRHCPSQFSGRRVQGLRRGGALPRRCKKSLPRGLPHCRSCVHAQAHASHVGTWARRAPGPGSRVTDTGYWALGSQGSREHARSVTHCEEHTRVRRLSRYEIKYFILRRQAQSGALSERLRRKIRNLLRSPCVGSVPEFAANHSPAGVVQLFFLRLVGSDAVAGERVSREHSGSALLLLVAVRGRITARSTGKARHFRRAPQCR